MSVAGSIADAIVTAIQALALVDSGNVVKRKVPSLPQGTDPPQIVVSVGEEGPFEPLWAGYILVKYPASVCIFTAGGKKLGDDETMRTWRQSIRRAVDANGTFSTVSEFNLVDWEGKTPFMQPAAAKDINASLMTFTVEAIEVK